MNKLEQLIQQHCPNGVEYVKLGEACVILDSQRKPISKSKRVAGPYPYYGANGIQDYVEGFLFEGDYLLMGEDGSVINPDGTPIINWATGKFWVNNHAHILSDIDGVSLLRYLYHALMTRDIADLVHGVPPKLNQENLRSIEIPLPPLPVQEEIVRILDAMSDLVDKLDEEIQSRRTQYEHYREQLLTFGNEVERKKLVEVADVLYGCPFDAKQFTEDDSYIPLIRIRDIVPGVPSTYLKGEYDSKYVIHKGDILVGMDGNFNLAKWQGKDGVLCQRSCKIEANSQMMADNGYLYHLLGPLFKEIEENTPGGSVKHLSAKAINAITIPLPPLSVQQSIVEKLDAFESLIQNLEAERDLRQQQYEFYREKLLTF